MTDIVDRWGNNPLWTTVFNFYTVFVLNNLKSEYYQWAKALRDKGFTPNSQTIDCLNTRVNDETLNQIIIPQ